MKQALAIRQRIHTHFQHRLEQAQRLFDRLFGS